MAASTAAGDRIASRRSIAIGRCGIRVFGGGTRSTLLLDALARRTGRPVRVGPVEAAALGNALVQALALGVFATLDDARATLGATQEDASER